MKKRIAITILLVTMTFSACGKVDEVSQKVMNDIDSLGEITLDDKANIEKLIQTYSTLTDDQKKQVNNYATLLEAQDKIDELIAEAEEAERIANIPNDIDMLVIDAVKRVKATLIKEDSFELKYVALSELRYKTDGTENEDSSMLRTIRVDFSGMNKAGGYTTDSCLIDYIGYTYDADEGLDFESADDGWNHQYEYGNWAFTLDDKQRVVTVYDTEKVLKWLDEY